MFEADHNLITFDTVDTSVHQFTLGCVIIFVRRAVRAYAFTDCRLNKGSQKMMRSRWHKQRNWITYLGGCRTWW
jgi:hypothetical protein